MNIAEEAAFCAKLSLFDTIVCNCLLKSVSNELRDAPCPDCVSADVSWTSSQHEQLPWDRTQPLSTPPGSPVTRHTSDEHTTDSTTDTRVTSDVQTSHTGQQQCDSTKCGNSDDVQHGERACSPGECENSNPRPKFLCYPVLLQSRRRMSFSKQQVEVFESLFEQTVYPDAPVLQEVADKTGVPTARLKTWFANKRSRLKKERSKLKLEDKDTPKTSPCKCRCKVKLPPLKKQNHTSAGNFIASKIYWDIDGHHLASKRGLVNSSCSCARGTFVKNIHDQNPPPHVSSVNTRSSNTIAVSTTNNSEQLNSGVLPLHVNVSPLLMPPVIVSSLTCSNAVVSLSHNVNLSHPCISSGHPSYQLLLTPTDRILASNSFLSNGFQERRCDVSQKQSNEVCAVNNNCENIENSAAGISGKEQVGLNVEGRVTSSTHSQNSLPCVTNSPVTTPSFTQYVQPGVPVVMNNFQIHFP